MKQGGKQRIMAAAPRISVLLLSSLLAAGCVMSEKYEAEKARSLNFQRLLAQEEKRTAELELSAQVDAVRQQAAQIQEEAEAMKEAALLERKAREDMKRMTTPAKPKKRERAEPLDLPSTPVDPLEDRPGMIAAGNPPDMAADFPSAVSEESVHTVQPGETLFRIGRKYHVSVESLKKWNNLSDDMIEVGQKLIVAQP